MKENNDNQIIFYTAPTGQVKIEVLFEGESIWLSQKRMADLFDCTPENIIAHLQNVYSNKELSETATTKDYLVVQKEGTRQVNRTIKMYNLDAIISVGYRVNSEKATQFRIWATKTLRDFIIKGFVLDDDRLKNGIHFGKDYFKELLERVRSIRASERRIYQQITDIFAEISDDYDPKSEISKNFYAMIQNKFHYAIAGQTGAEIIFTHADKNKENMGLTTWKNSPSGRILQSDVTVAKNYLSEEKIKRLERTVSGYFDYIENIIENRQTMSMKDLAESVDKFLGFNEYKILVGKGKISHDKAEQKVIAEYKEFNKTQKIESDFDKEVVKRLKKLKDKTDPEKEEK
ncbi:MAG: virulence RhuM family protein [bacterium]